MFGGITCEGYQALPLLDRLRNWPSEQKVNWTELGREFNIPGKNKGHVVKEFSKEHGIDVFQLDNRSPNTRLRARKLWMPGGNVSVPTHRTVEGIKEDWDNTIKEGELTLGEPCYPHTLIRYTAKGGELQRTETEVYGRKIPLLDLREKLLRKHEPFMYLRTDEKISSLRKHELLHMYKE